MTKLYYHDSNPFTCSFSAKTLYSRHLTRLLGCRLPQLSLQNQFECCLPKGETNGYLLSGQHFSHARCVSPSLDMQSMMTRPWQKFDQYSRTVMPILVWLQILWRVCRWRSGRPRTDALMFIRSMILTFPIRSPLWRCWWINLSKRTWFRPHHQWSWC